MRTVAFDRKIAAPDGIHDRLEVNEYHPGDTRWVTIGQLFFGTMAAFALMALYVAFAWIEG